MRRSLAVAAGMSLAVSLLGTPPAAGAEAGVGCQLGLACVLVIDSPPVDPAYAPDENGWTPGAILCLGTTNQANIDAHGIGEDDIRLLKTSTGVRLYVTIGCGDGQKYWSNIRQCFTELMPDPWPERPGGLTSEAGFYSCKIPPYVDGIADREPFWSETIPPGLRILTPGKAAARLISTFQLRGIDIGMAPEVNPEWGHRRSYVGIPVWMWVENPQPLSWGPYTETATLGGQTITATAKVSAIRWQMGDGGEKVCGSIGTPYTLGYGFSDSPTCGYRYTKMSSKTPTDRFPVTAASQWVVTWTSTGGASGTVNLTATSTVDLEVDELQSVNVTPGQR